MPMGKVLVINQSKDILVLGNYGQFLSSVADFYCSFKLSRNKTEGDHFCTFGNSSRLFIIHLNIHIKGQSTHFGPYLLVLTCINRLKRALKFLKIINFGR